MARRFAVRNTKSRREMTWLAVPWVSTTLTAAGGTLTGSLNAGALALRPFTIVRFHWEVYITSDQLAATEDQFGAVGAAVVSDEAAAAGVAAVPTPISELESDFFFIHQMLASRVVFQSSVGIQNMGRGYTIDSKAMRKVTNSQDIVTVVEVATAVSSGITVADGGRILVKLT